LFVASYNAVSRLDVVSSGPNTRCNGSQYFPA
jgi:hypothetical protein